MPRYKSWPAISSSRRPSSGVRPLRSSYSGYGSVINQRDGRSLRESGSGIKRIGTRRCRSYYNSRVYRNGRNELVRLIPTGGNRFIFYVIIRPMRSNGSIEYKIGSATSRDVRHVRCEGHGTVSRSGTGVAGAVSYNVVAVRSMYYVGKGEISGGVGDGGLIFTSRNRRAASIRPERPRNGINAQVAVSSYLRHVRGKGAGAVDRGRADVVR